MTGLGKQLSDHRLTTAEIIYYMPDHPALLQSYLWQDYDTAPHYPVLRRFLEFWQRELDGKLHSVRVATLPVIQAPSLRHGALLLNLTIH
ncbi:MAG TPA: Usg family protein [Kiloniellales bacterium]